MSTSLSELPTRQASERSAEFPGTAWRVLRLSARLLLEYNARAELIKQRIERVAEHLGVNLLVVVAYRDLTLVASGDRNLHVQVPQLRINAAVVIEVLGVLDDLCADRIGVDEAGRRLDVVERTVPRYGRWVVATTLGLAASALARLLGADPAAIAVAGLSSGVGVIARQALARRRVATFAQPFTAGLIGALLGGAIISLGWTTTPLLCLIVPALMLVPGPHLINGVQDMLENHMETGICRLGLAALVLMAAALGVLFGTWVTLGLRSVAASQSAAPPLTLTVDVVMAGVAAGGFGLFYNAPWRVLWVSVLCGMVGHGIRYACLDAGMSVEIATLSGCIPVGVIGAIAADRLHLPFSAVAFAGAVPMMPGIFIYESIATAMRLPAAGGQEHSALAAAALALAIRAALVVACIVLGLLAGASLASVPYIRRRGLIRPGG